MLGKKTGGRKKGSRNKTTVGRESALAGCPDFKSPLDCMLWVMNNDPALRLDAAKAAAPYVHPKLVSIEHGGTGGGPVQIVFSGTDARL